MDDSGLFEAFRRLAPPLPVSRAYGSPSFESWVEGGGFGGWPPPVPERGHQVWLLDSRDFATPAALARTWNENRRAGPPAACLILGRRRLGARGLKARARHLLGRGPRPRLDADAIARRLDPTARPDLVRLFYRSTGETPGTFSVHPDGESSGLALLWCRDEPAVSATWTEIQRQCASADPSPGILGVQFRARGALILLVGTTSGPELVVRVVSDPRLAGVVERNHASLVRLREVLRVARDPLLETLPVPLFRFERESALVLGESFLDGELAWRVVSGPLGRTVLTHSLETLSALRRVTERWVDLSPERMEDLIDGDLERLGSAAFVGDPVRHGIEAELRASEALVGSRVPLFTSHGDYGYGNILVNPELGSVTGVIDWDEMREVDLPGIDRVNFEIQRRRIENREPFSVAVRSVWEGRIAGEDLDVEGAGEGGRRTLFALAVCRYVLRYLTYPVIYRQEETEFRHALRYLSGLR